MKPLEYKITKADKTDAEYILHLQYIAYKSEAEIYNNCIIQPLTQTVEQLKAEFDDCVVLKAVGDDKIYGSVRAYEKDGTTYIGKLIVHPSCQNRGVGKRLMQAIEREFQCKRFELFTGAKSEKNLVFYENRGYKRFKTEAVTSELTFVYLEKLADCAREAAPAKYVGIHDIKNEFIQYGIDSYDLSRFKDIKNSLSKDKPQGGLWASPVDACFGWRELNKNNSFPRTDMTKSFKFRLSCDAKIKLIKSIEDLEGLPETQKGINPWIQIDFVELIHMGYDVVIVYFSNEDGSLKEDLLAKLKYWECDSILVMNKNVIKLL